MTLREIGEGGGLHQERGLKHSLSSGSIPDSIWKRFSQAPTQFSMGRQLTTLHVGMQIL